MESEADVWPVWVSWILSGFVHAMKKNQFWTNIEVDSDPKLPGAWLACKWNTIEKNYWISICENAKDSVEITENKKTATVVFRGVWMFYSIWKGEV